jgi:hypothetical protein
MDRMDYRLVHPMDWVSREAEEAFPMGSFAVVVAEAACPWPWRTDWTGSRTRRAVAAVAWKRTDQRGSWQPPGTSHTAAAAAAPHRTVDVAAAVVAAAAVDSTRQEETNTARSLMLPRWCWECPVVHHRVVVASSAAEEERTGRTEN